MKRPLLLVLGIISCSVWLLSAQENAKQFSIDEHLLKVGSHQQIRAWGYQSNTLFSAAGICSQCHGYDIDQLASVDAMGNDVNVMDAWAGTIMANSAKDPLWKAKVSHEVLVNPAHQNALESTCVKCHAPLGKYNALHLSQPYGMTELSTDSVGLDGVSCGACHQQRDTLIGKRFSGELFFTTDKTVYGPYTNPLGPMAGNTGFTPTYSPHINRAGLCAGCHTLITQTSDLSGNLTGDHFIEQATYHEWLNSRFNNDIPNPQGISCQGCHIPRINDPVKLSTGPPNLTRTPFGKHELVGANVFMLKLMKDNATALGLYSTARQLDSSIVRTERMLKQQSLSLTLQETSRTLDTAFYDLQLTNKAGHKFPSGYPSRRIYVEFVVRNDLGDTLFRSGVRQNDELVNENPTYEPHYTMINSEQQIQIYEMVMGDVNDNVTTVLERGKSSLKDNRLVPEGFTIGHPAYDTCKIIGGALSDPDFNRNGATEGTGADIIRYHIPLSGYTGALNVSAKIYYESVPKRFLSEMFSYSSPEISLFQGMYNSSDKSPVLVAEALLIGGFQSVATVASPLLNIFPNPSTNGSVKFECGDKIDQIELFDLGGRRVRNIQPNSDAFFVDGSGLQGTYIARIRCGDHLLTRKIVFY
ncbi:MAG TPA: hypothetical protein DEP18_01410 [Flavobacteriales bacterium]|nr:hypothetical protein [Flavobacteriales bacterium]HCA82414.1 hypothetical protein [Flavobacteriales bacterium]HRE75839.1 T9SS type A sorting domain-containing protein [Flavobacteriales bacterium]HRJ35747.1 T9SS type A sorting domain-containing protein [Flavobacteriales bacterium]HRJ38763.1 T9SS type A sorting domain-containing protein [Flavobacteriales bacterium]